MKKRIRVPALLGVALFAALAGAAVFCSATVSFRSAERDGARVAEVLIGDRTVIVLQTPAGGYSPLERAEIVASRLRAAFLDDFDASDTYVSPVTSGHALFIRGRVIVAAYDREASAQGLDSKALATLWRDNVLLALGLAPPPNDDAATGEGRAAEGPQAGPAAAPAGEEDAGPVEAGAAAE
jgi:hypothetical protein